MSQMWNGFVNSAPNHNFGHRLRRRGTVRLSQRAWQVASYYSKFLLNMFAPVDVGDSEQEHVLNDSCAHEAEFGSTGDQVVTISNIYQVYMRTLLDVSSRAVRQLEIRFVQHSLNWERHWVKDACAISASHQCMMHTGLRNRWMQSASATLSLMKFQVHITVLQWSSSWSIML